MIDIPANVTDSQLKRLLEERFDEGELLVQRTGSCSSFTWTVTWVDKGGNHPQLTVNGSLVGNQATIASNTINDGQFFLRPIPGEFLRTPHTVPQVSLINLFGVKFNFLLIKMWHKKLAKRYDTSVLHVT